MTGSDVMPTDWAETDCTSERQEAALMQLKSAPGWLLDDRDLLDEQGVSIAISPPVSSRKGSPKATAMPTLSEPTCTP